MENDSTLSNDFDGSGMVAPSGAAGTAVTKPLKRPASTMAATAAAKVHDQDHALVDPFSPRKRLKRTPPKGTPSSAPAATASLATGGLDDGHGSARDQHDAGSHRDHSAGAPRVLDFSSMAAVSNAGHTPAGQRRAIGPRSQSHTTAKESTPPSSPAPFSPSKSAAKPAVPRRPTARPLNPLAASASTAAKSNAIPTGRGTLMRTPLSASSSNLTTSTSTTGQPHFHPTLASVPATPLASKVKHTTTAGAASAAAGMPRSRVGQVHHAYDFTPSKPLAASATAAAPATAPGPLLTFTPRRGQPRPLAAVAKTKRMTFSRRVQAPVPPEPASPPRESRVPHRHLRLGYNAQGQACFVDQGRAVNKLVFALPGESVAQWEKVPEYVVDVWRNAVLDGEVHDLGSARV